MKKVLTFGVFDFFHLGHLNVLEEAKKNGDYLIVAIQEDDSILKYKPKASMLYNYNQRVRMIESLKIVDETCPYNDVDIDIKKIEFDIFAIGEDQNHEGFKRAVEWCKENDKEVIVMHYTHGISSTLVKRETK